MAAPNKSIPNLKLTRGHSLLIMTPNDAHTHRHTHKPPKCGAWVAGWPQPWWRQINAFANEQNILFISVCIMASLRVTWPHNMDEIGCNRTSSPIHVARYKINYLQIVDLELKNGVNCLQTTHDYSKHYETKSYKM